MLANFKFVRFRNGISAYSMVGIEAHPNSEFSVTWSRNLKFTEKQYASAVSRGINLAFSAHLKQGGESSSFQVVEFGELMVDTREDAVVCAAAAAAWISLGHSELDLAFQFEDHWYPMILPSVPTVPAVPSSVSTGELGLKEDQ